MASITIKTPKRSISLKASQKKQIEFFQEIENNISKVCIGRISKAIEDNYESQIAIIATFFQRVVSRTPVDERYERVITVKGEEKRVKHVPDNEVCREHWYIEEGHGKQKLYSKSMIKNGLNFNVVNDSSEINAIKEILKTRFPVKRFLNSNEEPSFSIANDCKHFDRLEYGFSSWKHDTSPVVGNELGREHGVQNKHSVQAPVGMLRITEAELESIRKRPSVRSLKSRYRGGTAIKAVPSDKKLKEFFNLLKKTHRIRYADIKRYIEEY